MKILVFLCGFIGWCCVWAGSLTLRDMIYMFGGVFLKQMFGDGVVVFMLGRLQDAASTSASIVLFAQSEACGCSLVLEGFLVEDVEGC